MSAKAQSVELARRAMQRSAAIGRRQMSQGVSSLAPVASLACLCWSLAELWFGSHLW